MQYYYHRGNSYYFRNQDNRLVAITDRKLDLIFNKYYNVELIFNVPGYKNKQS